MRLPLGVRPGPERVIRRIIEARYAPGGHPHHASVGDVMLCGLCSRRFHAHMEALRQRFPDRRD